MVSVKRVLAVTAGLSVTGTLVGAACAGTAVFIASALDFGLTDLVRGSLSIVIRSAIAGGILGSVLAPLCAFALLRSVPLGRAVVFTGVGTIVGSVVGDRLAPINPYSASYFPGIVTGALVGFVLAGLLSRLVKLRSRRSDSVEAAA